MSTRILHIITDLNGFGGTEATLLRYLGANRSVDFEHLVVVLKEIGGGDTIGAQLARCGVPIIELRQHHGLISPKAVYRLYAAASTFRPDVISAWLYHPCLLGVFLKWCLRSRVGLVWHIRSLTFSNMRDNPGRYLVQRILKLLLPIARPFLATNSEVVISDHSKLGFPSDPRRWTVIRNGIDSSIYYPSDEERVRVRTEMGVPATALLIGCIGRFVPEKGYTVFFMALSRLLRCIDPELAANVHVLAAGNGVSLDNPQFKQLLGPEVRQSNLHFLGKRSDVPRLLRGLDVFVLPSISEAFPNSLLEAMATGLPCVATDVGGCSNALSNREFLVSPNDIDGLARVLLNMLMQTSCCRARIGALNRGKVIAEYEIPAMRRAFDELFLAAAESAGSADKSAIS
jgi:glycosyltransferase involved in cell wall biosynthesis